jgi:hypothetical protein
MVAHFGGKKVTLQLPTPMMLVLSIFNSDANNNNNNKNNNKTFEEIRTATNLSPTLLRETLFSLSCVPRQNILLKIPENPHTISTSDCFAINENFVTTKKKLRLQMVRFRESSDEISALNEESRVNSNTNSSKK